MMGTGTFARPTLQALLAGGRHAVVGLVTQPDRDGTRVRGTSRMVGESMKDVAEAAGIPVFQPESINTAEGIAQLQAWSPDLLVVAAYGQILKRDVLETARLGGVNVHASLLPKYRGAAPVAWAIIRGETATGVTIIRMTTGLDAGDMLARSAVAIGPHETAGELESRLATIGADLAVETIDRLSAGPVVGEKQDAAGVTKAPKLTKELGAIDWTRPADEITRLIRGLQPWPTAYTHRHRDGQPPVRLILLKSEAVAGGGELGTVFVDGGHLEVATGVGRLRLLELQPAGKRRMTADEVVRGRTVQGGDRFRSVE